MTTTIVDTFNRADSASSLGTTSDGTATWTVLQGGPFGISSNQAYMPGSIASSVAYVDPGDADTTVAVKVAALTISTAAAGPAFRVSSANNYWAVYCLNTTATLYKVVGGAFGSQGTFTVAAGDTISVVLSGSSIVAKRNGATQLTVTDSTFSTATKHGLYMEGSSTRLDDFSVGITPAGPVYRAPKFTVRSRAVARASVI